MKTMYEDGFPMERVVDYFSRFFKKDVSGHFMLRKRDGYIYVNGMELRQSVFGGARRGIGRESAEMDGAPWRNDPDWERLFSSTVLSVLLAEQALREVAGEPFLLDFLRISRWPLFLDLSEGEQPDPGLMLQAADLLDSAEADMNRYSAVLDSVSECVYKELEFTITSGKGWRPPHPRLRGLDEADARLLAASEGYKKPVLDRYSNLIYFWMTSFERNRTV